MMQAITFQDAILRLQRFWADRGCLIWQPVNTEVGAGTMNPATFLRVLGPDPWNVAYVEPSVRPDDSRYGENPNRIQTHTQYQVILKPGPAAPQELYLESLAVLGIDTDREDVRFVEDNWQQPALGAWGLGWEVWLNGLEITQFTYFQQAGGIALDPVPVEITYGLERIVMAIQDVTRFQDIAYAPGVPYGDVLGRSEYEYSVYYLDKADIERTRELFTLHEREARALIDAGLALPAYGQLLRMSHLFNVVDARGAVGVAERAAYFARMRELAHTTSELWLGGELPPRARPRPPGPREGAQASARERPEDFLLEVGVEELPPADLDAALAHLAATAPAELARRQVSSSGIEVHGTPRRIVLEAAAVQAAASDELIRGPVWDVAFSPDGSPTPAGEGFARKHGLPATALARVEQDGRVFAAAPGARQVDVVSALADAAEALVGSIPHSRGMRWNDSHVLFARPVRWILALLGEDVVPVRFAGLVASRRTRLLRGEGSVVELAAAGAHRSALAETGIVSDAARRRAEIHARAVELAAAAGGVLQVGEDDPLLDEIANLVEAPNPLLASFDAGFLELPDAVLTTVMRRHQRYMPITAPGGGLLPNFVVVANGPVDEPSVREGNESVLRARFADARFFVAHDAQEPLEAYRERLDGIVFEQSLGSMLARSERIERLTAWLADRLLDAHDRETAITAARLSKCDLATRMVTEMTSLAGTMGGIYARRSGIPEPVAVAIEDHVHPAYAGDRVPSTRPGGVIALADRLDSLTGLMAAGHAATSTSDPYGLRRAALGLLQVCVELGLDTDLDDAVAAAAAAQPVGADVDSRDAVREFLARRFETWRRELGEPADVVRAVIGPGLSSPVAAVAAISELHRLTREPRFAGILEAYMRTARLARRQPVEGPVEPELFTEPAERDLYEATLAARGAIGTGAGVEELVAALEPLADVIEPFFDQVFVMVDDQRVARNRLALVRDVSALPGRTADLTALGESVAGAPATG